jgi:hypothetical protein
VDQRSAVDSRFDHSPAARKQPVDTRAACDSADHILAADIPVERSRLARAPLDHTQAVQFQAVQFQALQFQALQFQDVQFQDVQFQAVQMQAVQIQDVGGLLEGSREVFATGSWAGYADDSDW